MNAFYCSISLDETVRLRTHMLFTGFLGCRALNVFGHREQYHCNLMLKVYF